MGIGKAICDLVREAFDEKTIGQRQAEEAGSSSDVPVHIVYWPVGKEVPKDVTSLIPDYDPSKKPIVHVVMVFPAGTIQPPTPEREQKINGMLDDLRETRKILRRHWYDRYFKGIEDEEILSRYGRDEFGSKLEYQTANP